MKFRKDRPLFDLFCTDLARLIRSYLPKPTPEKPVMKGLQLELERLQKRSPKHLTAMSLYGLDDFVLR
jgi:hypothetical protein